MSNKYYSEINAPLYPSEEVRITACADIITQFFFQAVDDMFLMASQKEPKIQRVFMEGFSIKIVNKIVDSEVFSWFFIKSNSIIDTVAEKTSVSEYINISYIKPIIARWMTSTTTLPLKFFNHSIMRRKLQLLKNVKVKITSIYQPIYKLYIKEAIFIIVALNFGQRLSKNLKTVKRQVSGFYKYLAKKSQKINKLISHARFVDWITTTFKSAIVGGSTVLTVSFHDLSATKLAFFTKLQVSVSRGLTKFIYNCICNSIVKFIATTKIHRHLLNKIYPSYYAKVEYKSIYTNV